MSNSAQRKQTFTQGYACAVATLARMEGICRPGLWPTQIKELAQAGGIDTLEKCKKARVDQYDIDALFPKASTEEASRD